MDRRTFLSTTAFSAAAVAPPVLSEMPDFCRHDHGGTIDSIGVTHGFRADLEPGAIPTRRTTFMALLLEPYFRSVLASAGTGFAARPSSHVKSWRKHWEIPVLRWEPVRTLCAAQLQNNAVAVYGVGKPVVARV